MQVYKYPARVRQNDSFPRLAMLRGIVLAVIWLLNIVEMAHNVASSLTALKNRYIIANISIYLRPANIRGKPSPADNYTAKIQTQEKEMSITNQFQLPAPYPLQLLAPVARSSLRSTWRLRSGPSLSSACPSSQHLPPQIGGCYQHRDDGGGCHLCRQTPDGYGSKESRRL